MRIQKTIYCISFLENNYYCVVLKWQRLTKHIHVVSIVASEQDILPKTILLPLFLEVFHRINK